MRFLYPCDPLNVTRVEPCYQEEYESVLKAGLQASVIDIDNILFSKITPSFDADACIVYRGWMLSQSVYAQLEARFGKQLLISTQQYCTAHYLPNWYKELQVLTIPSIITDEEHVHEQFKNFSRRAFIKDYVKSLKTGEGSLIENGHDITRAIANMKHYRGAIEGGIVLREFVDIEPHSEIRFFVVRNTIFSPLALIPDKKYGVVEEVVKKLASKNITFYSVDVATLSDGTHRVIEIGDGQVSDYVGWILSNFMTVLTYLVQ